MEEGWVGGLGEEEKPDQGVGCEWLGEDGGIEGVGDGGSCAGLFEGVGERHCGFFWAKSPV